MVKKMVLAAGLCWLMAGVKAQTKWTNLDSLYQPLPSSMHVYRSDDSLDGKPNVMYYAVVDLKDKEFEFSTDTSLNRRLTPDQYYKRNNSPLLVVNCSFFSFATNRNLNVVIKNGRLLGYNEQTIEGKKKDTLTYYHSFFGALGISKKRDADIAWVYTDSSEKLAYASQEPVPFIKDSMNDLSLKYVRKKTRSGYHPARFSKWKMRTAIGGGPVLVQKGLIRISNNEERKFSGEAANNHEPRTAIGYTNNHQLVILVSEGRSPVAAGLTLVQEAKIFQELGCWEALNLDGGGSSCMLINGKPTNTPSSKGVQRPLPSVFLIKVK